MKVFNLIVKEEPKEEISDAYYRYESKKVDLGERFLDALDVCFYNILNNPAQFPKKHENMRQAVLEKFPFVVIFEIEKNDIIVYAIFHTSRNPDIWRNR